MLLTVKKRSNLCALAFRPDLVDMQKVEIQSNRENLEQAFEIAESLGVTRLLDSEGMCSFFGSLCIFLGRGWFYLFII